jgi:hypothetical protein
MRARTAGGQENPRARDQEFAKRTQTENDNEFNIGRSLAAVSRRRGNPRRSSPPRSAAAVASAAR